MFLEIKRLIKIRNLIGNHNIKTIVLNPLSTKSSWNTHLIIKPNEKPWEKIIIC